MQGFSPRRRLELIADSDAQAIEDAVSFILLKEQLDEVLSTLTTREKIMPMLRFGLADGEERTLEEA